MKKSILFLLLLVSCKEEKEPPPEDREFIIQFIDNKARTGNVLYYNSYYDTVKVQRNLYEESFLTILKRGKIEQYGPGGRFYGQPPIHRISLTSKEIKKISERVNFETMGYWKKTLFTDSAQLKLKNRSIKIVPAERGWIFTKPTFIRNNKYCFFGYSNSNRGGYYVYKKDSTGQWRQFIKINNWTIDYVAESEYE